MCMILGIGLFHSFCSRCQQPEGRISSEGAKLLPATDVFVTLAFRVGSWSLKFTSALKKLFQH